MRLATIRTANGTQAVHVVDDQLFPLAQRDVREVLETGPDWRKAAERHVGPAIPWTHASFAPLVPRPEKIFCVGPNYWDHVKETGRPDPKYPGLWTKFARSLIGAYDPIAMPKKS